MTEARPAPEEERLRRLVRDLRAVVKREVPWYEGNQGDPGITLLDLFAFVGDMLSTFQDQTADEAYLETQRKWGLILHHVLGTSPLVVTVDGSPWREAPALDRYGPDDAVYVADQGADGSSTVRFGDGQQGRRPPAGAQVVVTYRTGGGGGARFAAVVPWPPKPPLALEVRAEPARISFAPARRSWRDYLPRWLSAGRPTRLREMG